MRKILLALALIGCWTCAANETRAHATVGEGSLLAHDMRGVELGACPLRHTNVEVEVSSFVARVTVRQRFHNPFDRRIEAVYLFPMSQDAAVDAMTMKTGERTIKAEIRERAQAERIYAHAKAQQQVASLLTQERPNIFTQSVANIVSNDEVEITISYSEPLKWQDGQYQFVFPMVVGERYIPSREQVPDAERITASTVGSDAQGGPQTRAGHEISLSVTLNAGAPIGRVDSRQHDIDVVYSNEQKSRAVVTLRNQFTIPNRDFVLAYETVGNEIQDTLLTHTDERGKFFTLVLQPPKRVAPAAIVPKELYFVIDSSGSMNGFPLATAKQAAKLCIEGMHENDTFNLMTFSGYTGYCFPKPVANTPENRQRAIDYLHSLHGTGGTEMMKAINECLSRQDDIGRVRVVCFMTDGYIGNDFQVIDAVQRNAGTARVFSFGVGSSVNRFLLDAMARAGRGEAQYLLDGRDSAGAAERLYQRMRTPVLTDLELEFQGVKVAEVFPRALPDLFSSTPLVIRGQYLEPGQGSVTLRGKTGAGKFERKIPLNLPGDAPTDSVLASWWARAKVDDIVNRNLLDTQNERLGSVVQKEVTDIGTRYHLLTQFTSFVAVEKKFNDNNARIHRFESSDNTIDPAELNTDTLSLKEAPAQMAQEEQVSTTEADPFSEAGGGVVADPQAAQLGFGNFDIRSALRSNAPGPGGPAVNGTGGLGVGTGNSPGKGGAGVGFGGRGTGVRQAMLGSGGGTKGSERAVAAGLNWLARHQEADGSWNFASDRLPPKQNATLENGRVVEAPPAKRSWKSRSAATALGVLPFLAAGQTHANKGPYKKNIYSAIFVLTSHQAADGNLAGDDEQPMLSHALATFALCEAFGQSQDKEIEAAAKKAVEFIVNAQDAKSGGWAEKDEAASTELTMWCVLALSGANPTIKPPAETLTAALKFIKRVGSDDGDKYGKTTPFDGDRASTAAGLLARTYLDWPRREPETPRNSGPVLEIRKRAESLIAKEGPATDNASRNFYSTKFMIQTLGQQWDTWNRMIRKPLIDNQCKTGDEAGSWWNRADTRAATGGRLLQTSLSTLTLESYYRYLIIDQSGDPKVKE